MHFGPIDALTGPPARMPLLQVNEALGIGLINTGSGPPTTMARPLGVTGTPRESSLKNAVLQDLLKKRSASRTPSQVASPITSASSSPASPLNPLDQPGCSKWSGGPPLAKKLRQEMNLTAMEVVEDVDSANTMVELRISEVFDCAEAEEEARKFVLNKSDLICFERSFKALQIRAFKVGLLIGVDNYGDMPVENEYVVSGGIRTPINKDTESTINRGITAAETRAKPKVLLLGDSTLTFGHASARGNTYMAHFTENSTSRVGPCKHFPVNLTRLGDEQEFELFTFAISGLSAVYGLSLTPSEVKKRVKEEFGMHDMTQLDLIACRFGANDLAYFFTMGQGANTASQTEVEDGEPRHIAQLYDAICEYCKALAAEFNCAVVWLGAGCPAQQIPSMTSRALYRWSYPSGHYDERNRRYDDVAAAFIGYFNEKSDGKMIPVKVDGKDCSHAKFCTFAAVNPAFGQAARGNGHPHMKAVCNFTANMLNSIGVVLCKVFDDNRYVTYFLHRAGIPPRWNKDMTITPHSGVKAVEQKYVTNIDRLNMPKQTGFPAAVLTYDEKHATSGRSFTLLNCDQNPVQPQQMVRMKLTSTDDHTYVGGFVLGKNPITQKYICANLQNSRVYALNPGRVWVYQHWYCPPVSEVENPAGKKKSKTRVKKKGKQQPEQE